MPGSAKVRDLSALESFSAGRSAVHKLHPFVKIVITLLIIVITASFGRYDYIHIVPFLFYPFIMMAISELPYRLLLKRVAIALPFCLFAGIVNIMVLPFSYGLPSLITILIKMYICVMAALMLAGTTKFSDLTRELRRMHVPLVFVRIFETTYRYIGVLFEEAHDMMLAYFVRRGGGKALSMHDMGSFVGGLILRSFDRAERVHAAMRCRGYSLSEPAKSTRRLLMSDYIVILSVALLAIILRFIKLY